MENKNSNEQEEIIEKDPTKQVDIQAAYKFIKLNQNKHQNHYFYFRVTIIITNIISLGLGIYILSRFDHFLSKDFDFKSRKLLLFFIYIYAPSVLGILCLSFFFALLIYLFYCIFENERIHGHPLYDENDISSSLTGLNKEDEESKQQIYQEDEDVVEVDFKGETKEKINQINKEEKGTKKKIEHENTGNFRAAKKRRKKEEIREVKIREEYIGVSADRVTLFPYTISIAIIINIAFYFMALPLSIILLKKLWKHYTYKDKKHFWALYTFIFANLVNGILIVIVFIHMFVVKIKQNRIFKVDIKIDEQILADIRAEVRESLKKVK